MVKKWETFKEVYEEIFLVDRKKLKKECKRKKDKSLKRILFLMEKEERRARQTKNTTKFESDNAFDKNKKKRKRGAKKKNQTIPTDIDLGGTKPKFVSNESFRSSKFDAQPRGGGRGGHRYNRGGNIGYKSRSGGNFSSPIGSRGRKELEETYSHHSSRGGSNMRTQVRGNFYNGRPRGGNRNAKYPNPNSRRQQN
jgi:hypothetical protein